MSRGGEGADVDTSTALAGGVPLSETRLRFVACGIQSNLSLR